MHASWTEFVSASDIAPSPERYGHSLTTFNYDDILIVCFGGTSGAGVTSQVDTVWSWTVAKGWHHVSTSGPSPAHRAWHGAAAHGTSLYIFGGNRWEAQPGQKPTRSVHGDLWALDTESWTWRQIVQSAGELWPTSRSAMGMVAVGEGLLLYGGRGIGTGFLGDLWLFSPSSGRWSEVTPSPHLKAPQPRVLATFVSTPFGVFLYGGARQVASTPNARAPLCDLWHLKLEDAKGAAGQPVYVWEDCNKVPMCAVEHTVPAEDGVSPPPATTAAAGVRVVVGHDAHASAFVEPSHLVVWSGVLGRMPKRGMLASAPPPPQLTGNLFAIDLGAIDRGWSMVPAARLNAADSGVGPVLPRRWAAMSALGPGRAVVHGGLAEQRVLGQACVLEIQEAVTSPRVHSTSSGGDSAAAATHPVDLLDLDTAPAEPAARAPFPGATSPAAAVPDGTQAAKAQPPSGDALLLGPMKSSSVMSAVLGGVRRGMETISSEAASVIQRVTNTGRPEGDPEGDTAAPGQVRYSPPPALPSPGAGAGPQRGAAAFWGSEEISAPVLSRHFVGGWLRANSSAAKNSVKVLVATTDRLTKPRLSQQPAAHSTAATATTATATASEGDPTPTPTPSSSTAAAAAPQAASSSHLPGGAGPSAAQPLTPLTVQTAAGGGSEEEGEVESPVSLWISPSPTGPHSPLSADHCSTFASSRLELRAADADTRAVVDVMEEMLERVAERGARESSSCATADARSSGSGGEDFQFDKLPNAGVPEVPSVWPLGPPDAPPQRRGGSDVTSSAAQEPADKEVPTAYVQDMLATDPVHELGLRVTRISSSRLEFVSLSEAKTEMRRAACAWLLSVPCAECLRRKDVDALWTEYRRAAPNAMSLFGKGSSQKLGTLFHLARKDLRMRDVPVLLSEFKQLRKLAPAKSRPG